MSATVDHDDLAMLADGFEAAMRNAPDGDAASGALFDLGWGELLVDAGHRGAAVAFAALGTAGAATGILDDVLLHRLGLEPDPDTAVVLPAPGAATPPGLRTGTDVVVDGLASSRVDRATTVVLAVASGADIELVRLDGSTLVRSRVQFSPGSAASPSGSGFPAAAPAGSLDPGRAYRRVRLDLDRSALEPVDRAGTWDDAVAAGRVALAHQLVAAARVMLDQARSHAVDREQFGRAVATFQAVRHKLAEALVHIEGAAAVTDAIGDDVDPLLAALAKSLAGQAARTTAGHAQQVLAGIGFTTDHPFQHWLKRTLVLDLVLGSSRSLPAEIGEALLRRGGAPRLVEL